MDDVAALLRTRAELDARGADTTEVDVVLARVFRGDVRGERAVQGLPVERRG